MHAVAVVQEPASKGRVGQLGPDRREPGESLDEVAVDHHPGARVGGLDSGGLRAAVGETVVLLTLPSPSMLKHRLKVNDSLADGYLRDHQALRVHRARVGPAAATTGVVLNQEGGCNHGRAVSSPELFRVRPAGCSRFYSRDQEAT